MVAIHRTNDSESNMRNIRITTEPRNAAGPLEPESKTVFMTGNPSLAWMYLNDVWDYDARGDDRNWLASALNGNSDITGLSWDIGNPEGYHVNVHIQVGEFKSVNMGDAV